MKRRLSSLLPENKNSKTQDWICGNPVLKFKQVKNVTEIPVNG